jgi:plasmid stabilization system protein ParE
MAQYSLTDSAKADVREIVNYIRQRNPGAGTRVRSELRAAMRKLADFPGMGHARADVGDDALRFWPIYSYLIVYRHPTTPLQIIRVLHGARDIERILNEP